MQRAVGQSLLGKVALNGNALWIFAVLLSSRVPSECGHDLDLLGRDSDPSFGGIVTRISVACDIGTEAARRLPVGRLWNNFFFLPMQATFLVANSFFAYDGCTCCGRRRCTSKRGSNHLIRDDVCRRRSISMAFDDVTSTASPREMDR